MAMKNSAAERWAARFHWISRERAAQEVVAEDTSSRKAPWDIAAVVGLGQGAHTAAPPPKPVSTNISCESSL
jgi:hypothetical protein